MDFMVIFDVIIAGLGVYMIYSAAQMKKTGELSNIVVTPEEMSRCRDKRGFIDWIYNKIIIFAVVALLFGVLGAINDLKLVFGNMFNTVGVLVFLVVWFWFTKALRKGKEKFFY